ncbi:hypothetical protein CTEN210_12288 [Chaetoceros tenuissimus]|uniref:Uncharacterized protein n=1 Tax=Chaetoceros tenuissimus TaxID=426638 RepID=A0AAD3D0X3_9STRA|nr:hypothetical protein CTEN210_12288 [Chaetoceros tenuissimus]
MTEELLEIRYNGERIINPHANLQVDGEEPDDGETFLFPMTAKLIRLHLVIADGVEQIPAHLNYLIFVASIYPTHIKKNTMADSVKTLEDGAFGMFSNLEEVIWSKNLETIGERALAGCESLGKVFSTNFLPPTCRLIGPHAFQSTECLDMIIIPEHTLVHPSAFNGSKVWDSSPVNKDANPRELVNLIKYHQHDDYPIHAKFAKTHIDPEEIVNELCNNDEYLSSFACKKLHKDKDRYGLTPMDYLHRNPNVDETKFDELKLVKASIARIMKLDGV